MILQETLNKYGLNWEVQKHREISPLTFQETDFHCTIRMDTGQVLKSGFSSQYTPVQNREAFSFLDAIADDYHIRKMGSFKGGRRVFCTLDIGAGEVLEKDQILNRISFFNSHDGSSGLTFKRSIERVVCINGMTHIEKEDSFSIPHTHAIHSRLEMIISAIKSSQISFSKSMDLFRLMSEHKINYSDGYDWIMNYLDINSKEGRAKTIAENKQGYILDKFNNPEFNLGFYTTYSLYNAMTNYLSHYNGNEQREESKMIGSLYNENERILQGITQEFNLI